MIYTGPVTWATVDKSFEVTAQAYDDNGKVGWHSPMDLKIAALGESVALLFHTQGYTAQHPRLLFRGYADFSARAAPGSTETSKRFAQILGYSELSGSDIVPDVLTSEICYVWDDESRGALHHSSGVVPLIRVS